MPGVSSTDYHSTNLVDVNWTATVIVKLRSESVLTRPWMRSSVVWCVVWSSLPRRSRPCTSLEPPCSSSRRDAAVCDVRWVQVPRRASPDSDQLDQVDGNFATQTFAIPFFFRETKTTGRIWRAGTLNDELLCKFSISRDWFLKDKQQSANLRAYTDLCTSLNCKW